MCSFPPFSASKYVILDKIRFKNSDFGKILHHPYYFRLYVLHIVGFWKKIILISINHVKIILISIKYVKIVLILINHVKIILVSINHVKIILISTNHVKIVLISIKHVKFILINPNSRQNCIQLTEIT